MPYKPEGYPRLSPYMVSPNAERLITFLQDVFGGELIQRLDTPEGKVMHAAVRLGDSVVMLGQARGEWQPVANYLHLYVEDADATYKRALAAGAESVQEPTQRDGDADKRGGFIDRDGNTWWVATQLT